MKSIKILARLDISIDLSILIFEIPKNIDISIFLEKKIDIVSNLKLPISPITTCHSVVGHVLHNGHQLAGLSL